MFQCHKCRSINYDEKDPFLCNACGFCKYAKFEYTLTSRPTCAVDPIENEEDRKKAIFNINTLLDKADKAYKQLMLNKPVLENWLTKISESGSAGDDAIAPPPPPPSGPSTASVGSPVNQFIQQVAQRYCGDCKNCFEELSKIIQKVLATRKELVAYDAARKAKASGQTAYVREMSSDRVTAGGKQSITKCYGCAAASVEHCLTLLRALASKPVSRHELYQQGLIQQLLEYNLRRGTPYIRHEVKKLICLLTKDNFEATHHLNRLISDKILMAIRGHHTHPDLVESVRHEMTLLAVTVTKDDTCWEERLKCVLKLFLTATKEGKSSSSVMESITLPCLKILYELVKPGLFMKKQQQTLKDDKKSADKGSSSGLKSIDVEQWLKGDPKHSFNVWQKTSKAEDSVMNMDQQMLLKEKFFRKWRTNTLNNRQHILKAVDSSWLKRVIFNPSSRMARQVACNMIESFCNGYDRTKEMIDLLTTFLDELGEAGESASEYVALYQRLISTDHWKYYLSVKGVLNTIASLITQEIQNLSELENVTLNSDLAQGFALKTLTDIFSSFVAMKTIKSAYKGRLVSTVLHGYLSLRRLVVQRTKLVDQTQEKLLELLEDMTTGTEEETKNFMAVCVKTINLYPTDDQLTPVFIFERLCNLIYPEEADTGEFFMTLEKDPQQEDFLQGRMLGNPYSSAEPELGPLMRDIKNKICTDCELVALLEDDNGMELLVNNKIISLDLPVKDVYQKVWLPDAQEGEPMRIIYRMRGLLGDATEEFIETVNNKDGDDQDEEEVYRLANVMADCGGLNVMLLRLSSIMDCQYSKSLLTVLLKLFGHCIRVKINREKLLGPNYRAIPILLHCLKLALASEDAANAAAGGPSICEQILLIMERLLVEATSTQDSVEVYCRFASNCVTKEDIVTLLEHAVSLKAGTALHQRLLRVLPFLTYANTDKMALVINHFEDVLDFAKFDADHSHDDEAKMEAFIALCDGIERNDIGNTMKAELVQLGIVQRCLDYLNENAPKIKTVLVRADHPDWKEFVSKPSLKYVLRALAGLAEKHAPTQLAVSETSIPVLHHMEQVSSDEHIGSLAEAVLESLKGNTECDSKVKEARNQTKAEKKKLAMAMRAKQLKAFGLTANDRGQVKAENSQRFQQFAGLGDESGLCCNICREGYKFQPNKVLAIYTFTRPCNVDVYDAYSTTGISSHARRTMGYTTVTHFNLVHMDCHLAAVRLQRGREEWESAMLQNANTRCNGLLPLWGPQVAESAFASCLARHNTFLMEATRHRDIGYVSTIHDLKLLLLRFAQVRIYCIKVTKCITYQLLFLGQEFFK